MVGAELACAGLHFRLRILVDVSLSSMVGLSPLCTALRRHSLRLLAKEIVAPLGGPATGIPRKPSRSNWGFSLTGRIESYFRGSGFNFAPDMSLDIIRALADYRRRRPDS